MSKYKADVWYYMDEDNRKKEPKGPHCYMCKKPIDKGGKNFRISFKLDNPHYFRLDESGLFLVGSYCLDRVINQYGTEPFASDPHPEHTMD